MSRWELDALYHFEAGEKLRPYVSVGVGRAEYDFGVGPGDDDRFPSIGVGVKYDVWRGAELRGDFRVFNGSGLEDIERAASVGLVFVLGGTERPMARKPAEPSEPAPMPVAVRTDSDGDGVYDDEDACPGTPAGTQVDRRGCARDDDRDGVPNSRDACPDTTERQARIDEQGCYVVLRETVRVQLEVEFDFDSSAPRPAHRGEVARLAGFMKEYPQTAVVVEGHTDSRGNDAYNQRLSERRAGTIAEMLVKEFDIDRARVTSVGYGETRPVASNDTDEGRQKNRRVVGEVSATMESVRKQ